MSSRRPQPDPPPARRMSHAAIVCFSVSAIAFVACAMGLFVNHMLTGSLAISGTAAVGLIYLAMGVMNLGCEIEPKTEIVETPAAECNDEVQTGGEACAVETKSLAPERVSEVSSPRDVALSTRE